MNSNKGGFKNRPLFNWKAAIFFSKEKLPPCWKEGYTYTNIQPHDCKDVLGYTECREGLQ